LEIVPIPFTHTASSPDLSEFNELSLSRRREMNEVNREIGIWLLYLGNWKLVRLRRMVPVYPAYVIDLLQRLAAF
jgi:hypothetical protein